MNKDNEQEKLEQGNLNNEKKTEYDFEELEKARMSRKSYNNFARKDNSTLKTVLISVLVLALLSSNTYFALISLGKLEFLGKKMQEFKKEQVLDQDPEEKQKTKEIDYGELGKKVKMLKNHISKKFYKDVDDVDFESGVLKGLFRSLNDPYSVYFTKDEYSSFMEKSSGTYGGLGITISPGKDGLITVISTFDDTPAFRKGIKHDDKIIKVEGVKYTAEQLELAVSKMKGKPGTDVNITILRDGKEIEMNIVRAQIVIQSVKSELLEKDSKKIGYIQISTFDNKVFDEFKKNFRELEKKSIEGLVIDLRGNPGGSLLEVVHIADFLLDKQVIVTLKSRDGKDQGFNSDSNKINIPMVLLINKMSASASEILAAAVADTGSGVLVGQTTYGKGVVQTIEALSDGDAIKLTTAEYFTPNGKSIHGVGVVPDVEIELSKDYDRNDKKTDNQLQKALSILLENMSKK